MTPKERAEAIVEEWEGVKPSDGNWYQVKNLCGDIEAAINEAKMREAEIIDAFIRVKANALWEIGKRIEAAGKNGDYNLWHEVREAASDLHELARTVRTRSNS